MCRLARLAVPVPWDLGSVELVEEAVLTQPPSPYAKTKRGTGRSFDILDMPERVMIASPTVT